MADIQRLTMHPAMPDGHALKGVLLVVAAVFMFALADVATKHLTMLYAVPLVVALRYLVNLVLLVAVLGPKHGRGLWRTQRTALVVLRGLCLAVGSLTMGLALRTMPVGETIAIVYLSPFAVMLLAGPLLGEKVSLFGWIGAGFGFLGVLLIVRPGGGLDPMGVTYSLINAAAATMYHLLTRILSRTESTAAMLVNTALVGTVVFCAMLLWTPIGPLPGAGDLGLVLLLGVLATMGHFLFTAAYREAPASLLAPVNYLHLVWGGVLGWLFFSHVPDTLGLTGIALVALSGIGLALWAHVSRRPIPAVLIEE